MQIGWRFPLRPMMESAQSYVNPRAEVMVVLVERLHQIGVSLGCNPSGQLDPCS